MINFFWFSILSLSFYQIELSLSTIIYIGLAIAKYSGKWENNFGSDRNDKNKNKRNRNNEWKRTI